MFALVMENNYSVFTLINVFNDYSLKPKGFEIEKI
jgi:hypothetical protein